MGLFSLIFGRSRGDAQDQDPGPVRLTTDFPLKIESQEVNFWLHELMGGFVQDLRDMGFPAAETYFQGESYEVFARSLNEGQLKTINGVRVGGHLSLIGVKTGFFMRNLGLDKEREVYTYRTGEACAPNFRGSLLSKTAEWIEPFRRDIACAVAKVIAEHPRRKDFALTRTGTAFCDEIFEACRLQHHWVIPEKGKEQKALPAPSAQEGGGSSRHDFASIFKNMAENIAQIEVEDLKGEIRSCIGVFRAAAESLAGDEGSSARRLNSKLFSLVDVSGRLLSDYVTLQKEGRASEENRAYLKEAFGAVVQIAKGFQESKRDDPQTSFEVNRIVLDQLIKENL